MVSMRVFRYLLIFFVLQLHAEVSNANFNSQAPQTKNSEVRGASSTSSTQIANMHAEDVLANRKTLKHVNVNVEANEKNVLDIESKETVRKRKNNKRPTKTASLTADYSNPSHHSPRHN